MPKPRPKLRSRRRQTAAAETPADLADAPQPEVTVETLGGDDVIEQRETRERRRRNPIRQYKIQEVIKRRQILLVQVVKEERGNKGAALTTYLSLAGRYCVLMPNAGRGGGISRKISNPADRKRMKEMLGELDVPQGMGVILRTAGLERSTVEIKRDYEYLSRLWDSIREITMRSTAPALIYEEGDLIKRSMRDLYDTDIEEVLVEGEEGFDAASEFMRQLMPHQASKVELYKEPIPLFHRYQVEDQLDAMHSPVVQLRSGGYIVINPTEALVAIDVNSGRSTKERNIEETALQHQPRGRRGDRPPAAPARSRRPDRDRLHRHGGDAPPAPGRAQGQGRDAPRPRPHPDRPHLAFGLLELSRQRLRPSLLEHSTEICPHCAGTGRVRSIESAALHALRAIEEEGVRRRAGEIVVSVPPNVALYLLNQKRHALSEIEQRYGFSVTIEADDELHAADCEIERVRSRRDDRERPGPELARASYEEVADEAPADEAEGAEDREAGDAYATSAASARMARWRPPPPASPAPPRRPARRGRRQRSSAGHGPEDQPEDAPDTAPTALPTSRTMSDDEPDGEPHGDATTPVGDAQADGERASAAMERADGTKAMATRQSPPPSRPPRRTPPPARERRRRLRRSRRGASWRGTSWRGAGRCRAAPIEGSPSSTCRKATCRSSTRPMMRRPSVAPPVNVEAAPPPPDAGAAARPPIVAAAPQPEPPPPPPPAVPVIDAPPEKPKRGWWRR